MPNRLADRGATERARQAAQGGDVATSIAGWIASLERTSRTANSAPPISILTSSGPLIAPLPRMEAYILDGPHFLLETHSAECTALMSSFIRRVEGLD